MLRAEAHAFKAHTGTYFSGRGPRRRPLTWTRTVKVSLGGKSSEQLTLLYVWDALKDMDENGHAIQDVVDHPAALHRHLISNLLLM